MALGRLDAIASLLPNADLVLHGVVRKEAVLSSQIEGTQSSLSDLSLFESDGVPSSLRLVREMPAVLLDHPRGRSKAPGEFRRSQVWIGGTRPGNAHFVPPPAYALPTCLDALERFWHDHPEPVSPLLRAALAHGQFETIHPFLDGNGRVGRLMIVLQLVADGVLREPVTTVPALGKATGLTPATVNKTLDRLRAGGMVRETTERQRDRVYANEASVGLLSAELD